MSEFSAKTIREARKAKATRLGSADPHSKVDSSDWTPPDALNADVKTGARPLSRRAFKSGGKVTGAKAKANMGRKPRCGGGKAGDSWVNRNVKEANEERPGKKHVGAFKDGGRAKRAYGGRGVGERTQLERARRDAVEAATDYGEDPRVTEQTLRDKTKAFETLKAQTGYKKGGRTKKEFGGMMGAPGAAPMATPTAGAMTPPLNVAPKTRFGFEKGPQGSPYKKGGKVHSDEAMDKALIKKMVKPSARTGKADGGDMGAGAGKRTDRPSNVYQPEYNEEAVDKAIRSSRQKIGGKEAAMIKQVLKGRTGRATGGGVFSGPSYPGKVPGAVGGRTAKAAGGAKRGKGKTNINIIIGTGSKGQQDGAPMMPPGMPPMPPGMQRPQPMPPGGMPPMGPPPGSPPGMGAPPPGGMPPLARKSGGRITKVAKSYKDMEAGSGGGEGRLQKTDIAKLHKDAPARKSGGKVYRSYKDMDAGAGSGEGRLEKTEIQKRKR